MDYKKLLGCLLPVFILGMVLAFAGPAAAEHEGGLGIKKIPLNIASAEQLKKIEGVTDELAEAIIKYREKKGFFKGPKDLLKVPGLTEEIFKKMDPQVGAEGDLYCVPKEGEDDEDEEEDEDVPLSPSKC